jgi:Fe-S cluster assembly ATP-binding protein
MNILTLTNLEVNKPEKTLVSVSHFTVGQGSKVLLTGPNGSGKSSLLLGVMSYPGYSYSGEIHFDTQDISSYTTEQKGALGIFFIPQDIPDISGLTLLQMLYGLQSKKSDQIQGILEYKKEIEQKISVYGLSTELLLKHIGSGVSGGQKKQMELIALIALNPKLALIDEIDSGVDGETIQKICTVINTLAQSGTSFVVVSHNQTISELIHPDSVYECKEGKITLTLTK